MKEFWLVEAWIEDEDGEDERPVHDLMAFTTIQEAEDYEATIEHYSPKIIHVMEVQTGAPIHPSPARRES